MTRVERATGNTWTVYGDGEAIGTVIRMSEFDEHYARRADGSRIASAGCTVNIYYGRDEAVRALVADTIAAREQA